MEANIAAAGFDPQNLGVQRPKTTALMTSLLPAPVEPGGIPMGEFLYSLLSGYLHADPGVVMADQKPAGSGMAVVYLNAGLQIRLLRRAALRLLNLAMCMLMPLAGFDDDAWRARVQPFVLGPLTNDSRAG